MQKTHRVVATTLIAVGLLAGSAVSANDNPFGSPDVKVSYKMAGKQMSARDPKKLDEFVTTVDDSQIQTVFQATCQAGRQGIKWDLTGMSRVNEACLVSGEGKVKVPGTGQLMKRTVYTGKFTTSGKDGYTDMSDLKAEYLPMGNVTTVTYGKFGGSLTMNPENPAPSASDLQRRFMSTLSGDQLADAENEYDSIKFNGFSTPSAGFPSDTGCSWNGDLIFNYAANSWVANLTAMCAGNTVTLAGSIPWVDTDEAAGKAEYQIRLVVPSAAQSGDSALFAAPGGDLFAKSNGVTGVIKINEVDKVPVKISETESINVATQISAEGELVGTGVSVELVRSFANLMGAILPRALYGS